MSDSKKPMTVRKVVGRAAMTGWAVSVIVLLLLCIGCESDPILAPQNQVEQNKGSYGLVQFAPQGSDMAAKKENADETQRIRNSERF